MTTAAPDFEEGLVDLQDHLPFWWETRNPKAVIYQLLSAFGTQIDNLSVLFENPFLNSVLATANEEGLIRNFAFAYGLEDEQLPPTAERLRPYIQACAEMDGSLPGLLRILMAIIGANVAINTTGGTVLTFPAEGLIFPIGGEGFTFPAGGGGLTFTEGLTFPSSGEGLQLFQFGPGEGPKAGLTFPENGEGLRFPTLPSILPSENMIANTGELAPGAGPGLTFSQNEYLLITQNQPSPYQFTVEVLNWLNFDRNAFRRAIERYNPADNLPAIVQEVSVLV